MNKKQLQIVVFLAGVGVLLASTSSSWVQAQSLDPSQPRLTTGTAVTFEPPPGQDRPAQSAWGGSRDGGRCPFDAATEGEPLTALISGETAAAHPIFQVHIPPTQARMGEFSLFNANGDGVYQMSVPLPETSGVMEITLPANAPELEVGQDYQWVFAMICEPSDRLQDRSVSAWIRRQPSDLGS